MKISTHFEILRSNARFHPFPLLLVAFFALANLAAAQPAGAQRQLPTNGGEERLAQLVGRASVIVEGRAGESRSFWDAEHRQIYTATPVKLYKVFKGEPAGGTVEIITKGGQVGNSASACKDCNQVGLGLQPTGIFFLESVPSVDPKASVKATYRVVNGTEGFLQYESGLQGGANALSRWRLYPRVEATLYPQLTALLRQSYRVVAPFDPKAYNAFRERRLVDSLMYRRMAPAEGTTKPVPAIPQKKSANAKEAIVIVQPQAVFVSSFSPSTITAGTFDSLTINGAGFGTPNPANPAFKPTVQFINADDLTNYINTPALNIIRFTNTKIVLYVPSNDGSIPGGLGHGASSGYFRVIDASGTSAAFSNAPLIIPRSELTLNYRSPSGVPLNPQAYRQLRMTNRDGSGGMRFKYDPNLRDARQNAFVPTIKAVEATIRKWRCETAINLGDDVMQTVPFSTDSVNCNIAYVPGSAVGAGVLMETTQTYSYCRNATGTYVYITAIDIAVNSDIKWSYDLSANAIPRDTARWDFKTAMLHELGHGVGLDHVADTTACMYPYIGPYRQRYYLSTEPELNGGANILRRSTTAGRCYPPMVALTSTNCTGAQLTLSAIKFLRDPCSPPVTYSVTASGANSYKWYPASAFGGTNPTTPTVSFSTANAAPFVYGMSDGLGDFARTNFKPMPCSPTSLKPSTSIYPNPSSGSFTLGYRPTIPGEQLVVTLYNAQGTVVFSTQWIGAAAGVTQQHLIPKMPAGTYFLRTLADGRVSEVVQLRVE